MAGRRTKAATAAKERHTCGECGRGTWDYKPINLDIEHHEPICVICPLYSFKRVRSERACSEFVPKKAGK